MAVFVSDTFTDTDATALTSHTGETGATWTNHPSSGASSIAIVTNRAHDGAANHIAYASGLPAAAQYEVTAPVFIVTNASSPSICGRMDTTANTFYMARLASGGSWELFKRVAGTFTNLGSFLLSPTVGATYTLKLEITDATKKLFIDGTERVSSTDNAITAAGRAGLRSNGSSSTTGGHLVSITATDIGGSTAVTKEVVVSYDLLNGITKEVVVSYDLLNGITKEVVVSYDLLNAVAKEVALAYDLLNAVTREWAVDYNIGGSVTNAWVVSYNLGDVTVTAYLLIRWPTPVADLQTRWLSWGNLT